MSKPRILFIDIETMAAKAWVWGAYDQNVSIAQIDQDPRILSFAWQFYGEKSVKFASEFHDTRRGMLEKLFDVMDAADVVVGWNSRSFDERWISSELVLEGFGRPSPWKSVDLMTAWKKHMRTFMNKLDYVAGRLLEDRKVSHSGFDLWLGCDAGDPKAWARMRRYNKKDVALLVPLYEKMLPWLDTHPHMAASIESACPRCGVAGQLAPRGYTVPTPAGTQYRRLRCGACGAWTRTARREPVESEIRPVS